MNKSKMILIVAALTTLTANSWADEPKNDPQAVNNFWGCASLTNGFWGLNDRLADSGIEIGFSLTNIYQANVKGGLSTHDKRGRFNGSYDLEMWLDMRKLLGLETGSVYTLVEGGWPDAEGIDAASLSSAFGVNADAVGNQGPVVKELYYKGPIFSDRLTVMIGKIDFTGVFDASAYADNECSQFLNAALVDDPAIPFPDYSLGAVLTYYLADSWYVMGGIADAQADRREAGFRTTFHKEDYFFYALETGITSRLDSDNGPMEGTYRTGLWVDGQDKARFSNGNNYRDDTGVYLSCDQMLIKENSDSDDSQGLGGFFRFGYANSDLNEIGNFWSFGFQYQGLMDGRDEDVAGFGFASGIFSDSSGANDGSGYTENAETAVELYYSAAVTPCLTISPSMQYISDPGGTNAARDALVLGLRAKMTF